MTFASKYKTSLNQMLLQDPLHHKPAVWFVLLINHISFQKHVIIADDLS